MSSEELGLCPVCKTGHMRPLPKAADLADADNKPISGSRESECDNENCKHKSLYRGTFESH
jgi:hypothetical protein